MPGYGMPPPPRRAPTAAEGAVDVVPSIGRGRTGAGAAPPGSVQIAPPQQQMPMQSQMPPQMMGPDTGFMPPPGGMPPPGMVPPNGGMGMGAQADPIQQLIASLRRQAALPAQNHPFLSYLMSKGIMG